MDYKICANPNCRKQFHPNKYSRHQKICGCLECKRWLAAQRQDRYYERHSQNPQWAHQQSERKRRERVRRLQRQRRCVGTDQASSQPAPSLDKTLLQLAAGLISMVSGVSDQESVEHILHKCMRKGGEVYPESMPL